MAKINRTKSKERTIENEADRIRYINMLNQRLRKIKNIFGEDATYYNILDDVKHVNNIEMTDNGKGYYISRMTKDNLALYSANNNILTVSELLKNIKNDPDYVKENEKVSKQVLVELSNFRSVLTGSYSRLLDKLYQVRDKNIVGKDKDSKETQIYSQLEDFIRWHGDKKTEENLNNRRAAVEKFITSVGEINNYETEDYLVYLGVKKL